MKGRGPDKRQLSLFQQRLKEQLNSKHPLQRCRALAGCLKPALPVDGREVTPVERGLPSLKQEARHFELWEDVT